MTELDKVLTSSSALADYPNELLLNNIATNIRRNEHLLGTGRRVVRGHLWGSDTVGLLACLEESPCVEIPQSTAAKSTCDVDPIGTRFDVAVVAECLWLHDSVGPLFAFASVFIPVVDRN